MNFRLTSTLQICFTISLWLSCFSPFLTPSFFTSAKKSGFAGVLCGVWGGTIARKEVGATLLHGLAKGSAGPQSGAGPAALQGFHVFRTPVSKVRHQGAAHPFPIRLLQSESSCTVSQSPLTTSYDVQFNYIHRNAIERESTSVYLII